MVVLFLPSNLFPSFRMQLRIASLEKELAQAREDMRGITEEQEAANEELQSSNEELQSSNEEMQSLNEELETSKEELQSTNEELTIVNQELMDKQEQLSAARYYAESIVETVREPLLILNKVLCVIGANASFYKTFKMTEQDTEGKYLFELANHQWENDQLRLLLGLLILAVGIRFAVELVIQPEELFSIREIGGSQ